MGARYTTSFPFFLMATTALSFFGGLTAHAQIVVDGRTDTTVSNTGQNAITVTTESISQGNAINAFSAFNVNTGQTVNLVQPDATNALINIVTGDQVSQIEGTLNTIKNGEIGGNVIIANTNGIVVGRSGTVNAGQLTLTTPSRAFTDSLFGEDGSFNDAAFGDLATGREAFNNEADIKVLAGAQINAAALAVRAGRDIEIAGRVYSRFGGMSFNLADGARPNIKQAEELVIDKDGVIHLLAGRDVSISGEVASREVANSVSANGGEINIVAGRDIEVTGRVDVSALGEGDAGAALIYAGRDATISGGGVISANAEAGRGGFVEFSARETVIQVGRLEAYSETGDSGAILIDPVDLIIAADVNTLGADITYEASGRVTVQDGVTVSTREIGVAAVPVTPEDIDATSLGASGDLTINATEIHIGANARLLAHGIDADAGNISLSAGGLTNAVLVGGQTVFYTLDSSNNVTLADADVELTVGAGAVIRATATGVDPANGNSPYSSGSVSLRAIVRQYSAFDPLNILDGASATLSVDGADIDAGDIVIEAVALSATGIDPNAPTLAELASMVVRDTIDALVPDTLPNSGMLPSGETVTFSGAGFSLPDFSAPSFSVPGFTAPDLPDVSLPSREDLFASATSGLLDVLQLEARAEVSITNTSLTASNTLNVTSDAHTELTDFGVFESLDNVRLGLSNTTSIISLTGSDLTSGGALSVIGTVGETQHITLASDADSKKPSAIVSVRNASNTVSLDAATMLSAGGDVSVFAETLKDIILANTIETQMGADPVSTAAALLFSFGRNDTAVNLGGDIMSTGGAATVSADTIYKHFAIDTKTAIDGQGTSLLEGVSGFGSAVVFGLSNGLYGTQPDNNTNSAAALNFAYESNNTGVTLAAPAGAQPDVLAAGDINISSGLVFQDDAGDVRAPISISTAATVTEDAGAATTNLVSGSIAVFRGRTDASVGAASLNSSAGSVTIDADVAVAGPTTDQFTTLALASGEGENNRVLQGGFFQFRNDAGTLVGIGADIDSASGSIDVNATITQDMRHQAGAPDDSDAGAAFALSTPLNLLFGSGTKGGAFTINRSVSRAEAAVLDGADLAAQTVSVEALNTGTIRALANAGNGVGTSALIGVLGLSFVDNDTIARVEGGAGIAATGTAPDDEDALAIKAVDTIGLTSFGDGAATGTTGATVVGGGVNLIDRNTLASLGSREVGAGGDALIRVTGADIQAQNAGSIRASSVAGTASASSFPSFGGAGVLPIANAVFFMDADGTTQAIRNAISPPAGAASGVSFTRSLSLSGNTSLNISDTRASADVLGTGILEISAGGLALSASNDFDVATTGITRALGGFSNAVGGSLIGYEDDVITTAAIDGVDIGKSSARAGAVTVTALEDVDATTTTSSFGATVSGTGLTVTGAAVLFDSETRAVATGADFTTSDAVSFSASGDSSFDTQSLTLAGTVAGVTASGATSVNLIEADGRVLLSNVDLDTGGAAIDLFLDQTGDVSSQAVAGAASGGTAVGAGITVNQISGDNFADVLTSDILNAGAVFIAASDARSIDSLTGGAAAGASASGGAASSTNFIDVNVGTSLGSTDVEAAALTLQALNASVINSEALALGASGSTAGSASVSYNQINNSITSLLDGGVLTISGDLAVIADKATRITSDANSAAISGGNGASGSVALNYIADTVVADMRADDRISSNVLIVRAANTSVIDTTAIAGAGSGVGAGAGAVAYSQIGGGATTRGGLELLDENEAGISEEERQQRIRENEERRRRATQVSATVSSADGVQANRLTGQPADDAGLSALPVIATRTTRISTPGDTVLASLALQRQDQGLAIPVDLQVLTLEEVQDLGTQTNFAPILLSLDQIEALPVDERASYEANLSAFLALPFAETTLSINTIDVTATDESSIQSDTGAVAGGGTAGIGASASVNDYEGQVEAILSVLGANNLITRRDSAVSTINVVADGRADIQSRSAAGAAGGTAALAGATSINFLNGGAIARVAGGTLNADELQLADGSLLVRAAQSGATDSFSGGAAGGGSAGLAGAVGYSEIGNDARATLSGLTLNAGATDLDVSATTNGTADLIAASVGVGGAGFAGSAGVTEQRGNTSAGISNANLTTTGNLSFGANNALDTDVFAGALAAGAGAFGGGVSLNTIRGDTVVFGEGALITANDVSFAATSNSNLDTDTVAAALGSVAFSGAVAVNSVNNRVSADLGVASDLAITSSGSVSVLAQQTATGDATQGALAGGGLVLGLAVAIVDNSGTAEAQLGSASAGDLVTIQAEEISVAAGDTSDLVSSGAVLSGGVIGGGAAAIIDSTNRSTVGTIIGSGVSLGARTGNIDIIAASQTHSSATTRAAAFSGGVAAGFSQADAQNVATVSATVLDGADLTSAGEISITSALSSLAGRDTVEATAFSAAGGVGAAGGARANAVNSFTLNTVIGDADLVGAGGVSLVAEAVSSADADVTGLVFGGVALGGVSAFAGQMVGDATNAAVRISDGALVAATEGEFEVNASVRNTQTADATSGAGGIVTGNGSFASTNSIGTAEIIFENGTSRATSTGVLAEGVDIATSFTVETSAQIDNFSASLLGVSGALSDVGSVTTSRIDIGENVQITSTDALDILAANTVSQLDVGNNVQSSSAGLATLPSVQANSRHTLNTSIDIGDNARIDQLIALLPGQSRDDFAAFNIGIETSMDGALRAVLDTGGLITLPQADIGATSAVNSAIDIGEADLFSSSDLNIYNLNTADYIAALRSTSFGLAGAARGNSTILFNANETIDIAAGAELASLRDIYINASGSRERASGIAISADTRLFNRTLFSFSNPNVAATVDVNRALTIGDSDATSILPQLVAVRNVDLIAEDSGTSAAGNGLGTSALLEALRDAACAAIPGECFIPSTTVRITNQGNNAVATIDLNADIIAGDRAIQTLIIRDFADAEEGEFNIGDTTGRLVLDDDGNNIAPSTIISNDENARIRSGDVVEQSDGISFQFENGISLLDIANDRIARLEAERDAAQTRLAVGTAQGTLTMQEQDTLSLIIDGLNAELISRYAELASIPATATTTVITLNDIIVDEGSINITAGGLSAGRGSLTANGNAQVNVLVDAPFNLISNNVTVGREEGGFIRFNDVLVNSSAELAALNDVTLDAGFAVSASPDGEEPLIRLENSRVFGPDTTDISLAGNIVNFRGGLEVATGLGNINITGRINAENVRLDAPRGAITQSPITGLVNTGGAPQFQFRDDFGGALGITSFANQRAAQLSTAAGLLSGFNSSVGGGPIAGNLQDAVNSNNARSNANPGFIPGITASGINGTFSASSNIAPDTRSVISAGESVFLAAEIININGRVEAGQNTFNLDIGAGANAEIAALRALPSLTGGNLQTVFNATPGASGNLSSIASNSNVNLIYDRARNVLIVEPLVTRPGRIDIFGQVVSTGNGELFARDGFGRVDIKNASDLDLEFTSISTGDNADDLAGTIVITDASRNRGLTEVLPDGQTVQSIGTQFTYRRIGNDIVETTRVIDGFGRSLSGFADTTRTFTDGVLTGSVTFAPVADQVIRSVFDRNITIRQSDRLVEFQSNFGAPVDYVFDRTFEVFADPLAVPAMPTFALDIVPNAARLNVTAGSLGLGSFLLQANASGLENAQANFGFGNYTVRAGNLVTRGFINGNGDEVTLPSGINLPVLGQSFGQSRFVSNNELARGNLTQGGRSIASLFITEFTVNDPLTVTIRADLPIGINFDGNDTPQLNITSTGAGQILFTESVLNRGAAAVVASSDILAATDDVRLSATDITLISDTGRIGGLAAGESVFTINQIGDAASELNAFAFGDVALRGLGSGDDAGGTSDSTLRIGQVASLTGDVSLRARGDLLGADTFQTSLASFLDVDGDGAGDITFNFAELTEPLISANVSGESISLVSDSGSIGAIGAGQAASSAAGAGLVAGTDTFAIRLGQSETAQFNATANDDVAIVQATGDLFVETISAGSGSVLLDIQNGQVLDRDDVTVPDVLARTALIDLFSELGLLEPDDPAAPNPVEERVNRQRRSLISAREIQFLEYIRTGGNTGDLGGGEVNINQGLTGEVENLLRDVGPGFETNADIRLAIALRAEVDTQTANITEIEGQIAALNTEIMALNMSIAAGPVPDVLVVLQRDLAERTETLGSLQGQQTILVADRTASQTNLANTEAGLDASELGAVVSIIDLLASIDEAANLRADGSPAAMMMLETVEADIAAALLTDAEREELTFVTSDAAFRLEELEFGVDQAFIDILLDPLRTGVLPPDTEFDIEQANILARNGDIIINQAAGVGSFDEGIELDLSLVSVDFESDTMPGGVNTSDTIAFNRNIFEQTMGMSAPTETPEDIFFALLGASRNDLSINLSTQEVTNGGVTETISQAGLTVRRAEDIDIAAGGRIIFNSQRDTVLALEGDLFVGSEDDVTLGAINADGETRISTSANIFDEALQAAAITTDGSIELEAAGGQIGTESQAVRVAQGAGGNLSANSGRVFLTSAGDVTIGIISATDSVSLFSDGNILDGFGGVDAGIVNILSDQFTLRAGGQIGTVTNALELRQLQGSTLAGLLELSAGQTINVIIEDDSRLGLIESRNLVGLDDIDLTLNGDAAFGTLSTMGDAVIRATGNLADGTGTSVIADTLTLQARNAGLNGNAFDTSVNALTLTGTIPGSVFLLQNQRDTVLDASALSGLVLSVNGDLAIARAQASRDLILTEITGNLLSGALEAENVEIGAAGVGGAASVLIDANAVSIETTSAGTSGDINTVLAAGDTQINTIDLLGDGAGLNLTGAAANITLAPTGSINATSGDISISVASAVFGGSVQLSSGDVQIDISDAARFDAGSLLRSETGALLVRADTVNANGMISTGTGDISIESTGATQLAATSRIFSDAGNINFEVGLVSGAGLTQADLAEIEAVSGSVQITSGGDLQLASVFAGNTLSVLTEAALIDTGAGDAALASAGVLSVAARSLSTEPGLGLTVSAETLSADIAEGDVHISVLGDTTLANLIARDGLLDVFATGALTVGNATSINLADNSLARIVFAANGALSSVGAGANLDATSISLISLESSIGASAAPFVADTSANALVDLVAANSIVYQETAGDLAVNIGVADTGDLVLNIAGGALSANALGAEESLRLSAADGVEALQIGGDVPVVVLGNVDLGLINQSLYGQRILRTPSGFALTSPGPLVIQNIQARDRLELEAPSIDVGVTDISPENGLILLVRGPGGAPVSSANIDVVTEGALVIEQLVVTEAAITTTGRQLVLQDGTVQGRATFRQGETDILVTNPALFDTLSPQVDIEGQTGPDGAVSFALDDQDNLTFSPVLLNHRQSVLIDETRDAFFAAATEIAGVLTSARNDLSSSIMVEVIEDGELIDRVPVVVPNGMNAAALMLSMFQRGALQAFLEERYGRPVDFVIVTAEGEEIALQAAENTPAP